MKARDAHPVLRRVVSLATVAVAGLVVSACPPAKESKISAVLPLTGEYALYGEAIQRGMQIAEEEIAANRPELAMQVEYLDSGSSPETGKAMLEQAYSTGAIAAIGGVTSSEALAGVEVAEQRDRALLSPTASSPELSGKSRNFFRIFPSADVESAILAGYISDKLASESLAILYQNDAYGTGATESLESVFTGEVVAKVPFEIGGDLDAAIASVVEADPASVYVAAIGEDLARSIRGLRDAGIVDNERKKQWILTSSALVSPTVLESAGRAANRVFLAQTAFDVQSEEEAIVTFVTAYEQKFGEKPGYYEAHGYDVLRVAAEALSEADSGLAADFIKGLRGINNFAGATGSIQFRETGDVQKFTKGYWVVDGNPVDYEQYIKRRMEELQKQREELQRQLDANARRLQEG